MPQFNLIQAADRSPSCCMACGGTAGPFIDFDVPYIKVPTDIGVLDATGGVYLCVGTPENPGCVIQAARMTGRMVDTSKLEEQEEHNATLHEEIADLRGALSKKTITVGDAMLLAGATHAV